MHGHAQRAFAHPQFDGDGRAGDLAFVSGEKSFQPVKLAGFARRSNSARNRAIVCSSKVNAQRRSYNRSGEMSPAVVSTLNFRSASSVSRGTCVWPPPRFWARTRSPFVGQKTLERHQQKTAEAPALRFRCFEIILFQQPGKKCLRQVLGIFPGLSGAPHIGVKRIPISAAEFLQRLGGPR